MLECGVMGYCSPADDRPCHLLLSNNSFLKVSVFGTDVGPRFECFSLALDIARAPKEPVRAFKGRRSGTAASVLLREEYTEPFTGDSSGLVGTPPTMTQTAIKPGHVPEQALASCVVAYGLLIAGDTERLIVAADWSPYKLDVTTDEVNISALLAESEIVSIADYVHRFGSHGM
jgi:hypothetical protein